MSVLLHAVEAALRSVGVVVDTLPNVVSDAQMLAQAQRAAAPTVWCQATHLRPAWGHTREQRINYWWSN